MHPAGKTVRKVIVVCKNRKASEIVLPALHTKRFFFIQCKSFHIGGLTFRFIAPQSSSHQALFGSVAIVPRLCHFSNGNGPEEAYQHTDYWMKTGHNGCFRYDLARFVLSLDKPKAP